MQKPRVAPIAIALFSCSLLLTACGGGGGGGGSTPIPPATATPTPTPGPITKSQARASMQTSLSVISAAAANFTGTTTLGIIRKAQAIHHGRRPLTVAGCSNGYTTSTVTHADGSSTATDTYYYDQQCTLIEEVDVYNIPPNPSLANVTITGSVTTYSRGGSITAYLVLSVTLQSSSTQDLVTLTSTQYPSPGAQAIAQTGVTCVGPPNGLSIHCGDASVSTSGGTQIGLSLDDAITGTSNGSTTTITSTVTASDYAAASGLAIQQGTAPSWTVTGASPLETLNGTVTISVTGGTVTAVSVTITDVTNAISVSGTFTQSAITMTSTGRGATVATLTVNLSGNGTITYADGTTATISAWTITG
jgi:hypothetical protein